MSYEYQRYHGAVFPLQVDWSKSNFICIWSNYIFVAGVHGVFQGCGGRVDQRQFRGHLRASRWNDGLRIPTDNREQDSAGVRIIFMISKLTTWSFTFTCIICKSKFEHISELYSRFITQEGHKLETAPRPPMAVTNAVSWRSEGIKYRKNEVFLDVIESVNMLVGSFFFFFK